MACVPAKPRENVVSLSSSPCLLMDPLVTASNSRALQAHEFSQPVLLLLGQDVCMARWPSSMYARCSNELCLGVFTGCWQRCCLSSLMFVGAGSVAMGCCYGVCGGMALWKWRMLLLVVFCFWFVISPFSYFHTSFQPFSCLFFLLVLSILTVKVLVSLSYSPLIIERCVQGQIYGECCASPS